MSDLSSAISRFKEFVTKLTGDPHSWAEDKLVSAYSAIKGGKAADAHYHLDAYERGPTPQDDAALHRRELRSQLDLLDLARER